METITSTPLRSQKAEQREKEQALEREGPSPELTPKTHPKLKANSPSPLRDPPPLLRWDHRRRTHDEEGEDDAVGKTEAIQQAEFGVKQHHGRRTLFAIATFMTVLIVGAVIIRFFRQL